MQHTSRLHELCSALPTCHNCDPSFAEKNIMHALQRNASSALRHRLVGPGGRICIRHCEIYLFQQPRGGRRPVRGGHGRNPGDRGKNTPPGQLTQKMNGRWTDNNSAKRKTVCTMKFDYYDYDYATRIHIHHLKQTHAVRQRSQVKSPRRIETNWSTEADAYYRDLTCFFPVPQNPITFLCHHSSCLEQRFLS